jgi:hypothetical protein
MMSIGEKDEGLFFSRIVIAKSGIAEARLAHRTFSPKYETR